MKRRGSEMASYLGLIHILECVEYGSVRYSAARKGTRCPALGNYMAVF